MRNRLPILLSTVALVVAALGSTPLGQAAQQLVLPRNSVGTPQLKNGAVATAKIKSAAVTGAKVKPGSLLAVHFKPGQLPAWPQGPQGPAGPAGPQGPPGKDGVSGVTVRTGTTRSTTGVTGADAACNSGEVATGGGFNLSLNAAVLRSLPYSNASAWFVTFQSTNGSVASATPYVVCAATP
jgi:hypothetical protein